MEPIKNIWFERDDKTVKLKVGSGLETCKPIFVFHFHCETQEWAELLTNYMQDGLQGWLHEVCKDGLWRLTNKEISALKKTLRRWHAGKHWWR